MGYYQICLSKRGGLQYTPLTNWKHISRRARFICEEGAHLIRPSAIRNMGKMTFFLGVVVCLFGVYCEGYLLPWIRDKIPLKEVVEVHETTTIKKIYDTGKLKDILQFESMFTPIKESPKKKYELTLRGGKNCGSAGTSETIYINSISMKPSTLILGDNATFAADVTVNSARKGATLASVLMRKVGLPFDIPCTQGVGSCNYTNPCQLLEKIKCPKEVVAQGWNCRCPIPVKHYSFGPITATLPTVPLPAFLVNGQYQAKAELWDGKDQLLCYILTIDVKEK